MRKELKREEAGGGAGQAFNEIHSAHAAKTGFVER
jgi:hypothetical protein